MWRNVRIAILLFLMALAAYSNWFDRLKTTDWDETLWVGVFPINAAGDAPTAWSAASPPLEPPEVRIASYGLFVRPKTSLTVSIPPP